MARRRLRSVHGLWLAGAALLAVSCSLLVPGEVPAFTCAGDDPSSCPPGMACDLAALRCVVAHAAEEDADLPDEDDDAGPDGPRDAGPDAPAGPAAVGEPCVLDEDCRAGLLCGSAGMLRDTLVPPGAPSLCTKTCCTSANCPSGSVCFGAGTGGNYCVPSDKLGRRPPPSGGGGPGAACAADGDCRSGLCGDAGFCVDTCCGSDDCAGGTTCSVETVADHVIWSCAPPVDGGLDVGAVCSSGVCSNKNCAPVLAPKNECAQPCCSDLDCGALPGSDPYFCAYSADIITGDRLKWCFRRAAGAQDAGASCSNDAQCASRFCDGKGDDRACAVPCCVNQDCPTDQECRPTTDLSARLRCVPKRR